MVIASSARADIIDDYIRSEMERQKIPGLAISVLKDGKTIKSQGYGLANVELNVPVKPETVFKIGSVSKQFIASGIMLLVADGKIGLDDKIGKYLEGTPETWNTITVRHLLTHTSGLVRESPGFDGTKVQSDAVVIKAAYATPLQFPTGDRYQYCNLGYFILAEIIHKTSGKPWSEFINERIFAKVGMTATRVTSENEIIPNRANGYGLTDGKLYNEANFTAVRPSGAFVSNVVDLAKWEAALNTESILSAPIRTQMWTPMLLNNGQKTGYGFGWVVDDFRGIRTIQHGGALGGFLSQYLRVPEYNLTVIILINQNRGNPSGIARGVMTKYVPGTDLASLQPVAADASPEQKTHLKMLEDFATGSKDLPQATPELNTALANVPPAPRNTVSEQVKKQTSFVLVAKKNVSGKGIVRSSSPVQVIWSYRSIAPAKTTYFTFYTTADNKIAHMEPSDN
jgi:D-alanyl-D-alanine carboxypeptidase